MIVSLSRSSAPNAPGARVAPALLYVPLAKRRVGATVVADPSALVCVPFVVAMANLPSVVPSAAPSNSSVPPFTAMLPVLLNPAAVLKARVPPTPAVIVPVLTTAASTLTTPSAPAVMVPALSSVEPVPVPRTTVPNWLVWLDTAPLAAIVAPAALAIGPVTARVRV